MAPTRRSRISIPLTAFSRLESMVECHSEGEGFRNAGDYSKWESHFLSLAAVRRTGPGFDSVSDDYRSDWWFSLPPRRVLDASSVDAERLYRRRLAWELVRGRDQETAGQGERGGGRRLGSLGSGRKPS